MDLVSPVPRHNFMELNRLSLSLHLGSFGSEVINWGFFEPHWWRNYLHVHSCFEVCYAFQGQGLFRISGHDYQVQAGEVFVARPGETHEIISSEQSPLGIYFWSHTLTLRHSEPVEKTGIDAFLSAYLASPNYIGTPTSTMERTLELLTEEAFNKEPGYVQAIEGLVVKLLLDTARAVVDMPAASEVVDAPAKSPEEAVVQTIVHYLRDNYSSPLCIRDVAAQVHLSERHTSRLFRNIMGTSIMDYLTTLRLETAEQLLLDQQVAIKEVALATGYPDVRYFTTLFRQHTGLTPASFRQKRGTRFIVQADQPVPPHPGHVILSQQ